MASSIKQLEFDRQLDLMKIREFRKYKDQHLVDELFSKYAFLIYGVGLKYLGTRDKSKTLVTKVYEKLTIELVKNEVKNLRGWLYITTKNTIQTDFKNDIEGSKPNYKLLKIEDLSFVHLLDEGKLQDSRLKKCLLKISEVERACIELFYYKRKHYAEIATHLAIDEVKVKEHIANAKASLNELLNEDHERK